MSGPLAVVLKGETVVSTVSLTRAVMGVGRHPENDIVVDDRSLSRFHARIERRGDRFFVVDLGAQNGVFKNGERIQGEAELAHDDVVGVGRYSLRFEWHTSAAPPPNAGVLHDPPSRVIVVDDVAIVPPGPPKQR